MILTSLLIGAGAAILGGTGIAKGVKAVSDNSEANNIIMRAQRCYDNAKERLENQKEETTEDLEKLGKIKLDSWANDIGSFLELYKTFKNVRLERNVELNENLKLNISDVGNMRNMEVASMKAAEVLSAGASALGAGALAGVASYGGAMMFASASTGTAIASLSGAAATNATLAWFGGGSLAAGGLGMAGGTVVLGGIVAAPILAVSGFIMAAKAEENLAKAKETYAEAKNAAEQMDTMKDFMSNISEISDNYSDFIIGFSKKYKMILNELAMIRNQALETQKLKLTEKIKRALGGKVKVDFRQLDLRQQKLLHLSLLMTQVLYNVLAAPILTEDGDLHEDAEKVLADANDSIAQLEQQKKQIESRNTEVKAKQNATELKNYNGDIINKNNIDLKKTLIPQQGKDNQIIEKTVNKSVYNKTKESKGKSFYIFWYISVSFILSGIAVASAVSLVPGIIWLVAGIWTCPSLFREVSPKTRSAISFIIFCIGIFFV